MRPLYVAVVGAGEADERQLEHASDVGRGLAEHGAVVVTGGLGGVMEAASRGAREAGGVVLAVLPSDRHEDANEHATVVVPTGLGEARNALVVRCADALVAVGGGFGTLSEIALAFRTGRPVIGLGTWQHDGLPIRRTDSPAAAVRAALDAAGDRRASR